MARRTSLAACTVMAMSLGAAACAPQTNGASSVQTASSTAAPCFYADQVRNVAAGLAGLGVSRGDTVSLMMSNRVEFYPLDVGAQHTGATSFSVYNTLPATDLVMVLSQGGQEFLLEPWVALEPGIVAP